MRRAAPRLVTAEGGGSTWEWRTEDEDEEEEEEEGADEEEKGEGLERVVGSDDDECDPNVAKKEETAVSLFPC